MGPDLRVCSLHQSLRALKEPWPPDYNLRKRNGKRIQNKWFHNRFSRLSITCRPGLLYYWEEKKVFKYHKGRVHINFSQTPQTIHAEERMWRIVSSSIPAPSFQSTIIHCPQQVPSASHSICSCFSINALGSYVWNKMGENKIITGQLPGSMSLRLMFHYYRKQQWRCQEPTLQKVAL